MKARWLAALVLLSACVSTDPFGDVAGLQRRLDDRGMGFGVTRVPGHDALLLQVRFSTSSDGEELNTDPLAAAQAAAPEGCEVESVEAAEDGVSYRVEYAC